MKKFFLPLLFCVCAVDASAQVASPSVSENFDVACVTDTSTPHGWLIYNPIVGTFPDGAWQCNPLSGNTRNGSQTPGMSCTGYYNGSWHLDTSILITPKLNFSGYAGKNIYLEFDAHTSNIHTGARLSLMLSHDSVMTGRTPALGDISDAILPMIDENDSANWVTHTVNLSGLITQGDFYLAFRYTSTDTSGKVWYLDNIHTVTNLKVTSAGNYSLPITQVGDNASGKISVAYTASSSGIYAVRVYDMMGRQIYNDKIEALKGKNSFTTNQGFSPGTYVVRISCDEKYGVARVIVP